MKKAALIILFTCTLSLWGADRPHRFIELGVDANASFANSYLTIDDVFQDTLVFDFNSMVDDLWDGLGILLDARARAFFNVNLGVNWGFGLFAGVDSVGQFKLPGSLMELLSQGNRLNKTYSDKFGLGAAVFAEAGVWGSANVRRIQFTVQPAFYVPLVYLDRPVAKYSLVTRADGSIEASGKFSADIYTPMPIPSSMGNLNLEVGNLLSKGGIDLTLRAEYPLLRNLSIGAALIHIPVYPAQVNDYYTTSGTFGFSADLEIDKDQNTILDIINGDGDFLEYEINDPETGKRDKVIFRPFKISFDADYRPFTTRLFSLRPALAMVFNRVYDTPIYIDFGVTARLNLWRILTLDAGTRLEDLVWKQRLALALNLRVVEFDVGINFQSQQFLKSFQGAGFGVDVGFHLGF
jgi:hypothetical protein